MIYLYEEGDYERKEVTAIYEVEDGLDICYTAFLISMGFSPAPSLALDDLDPIERRQRIVEFNQWCSDRTVFEREHNISDMESRDKAHRQWIETLPGVKSLPFERVKWMRQPYAGPSFVGK
jgi:hypothetical protein